MGPLRVDAATPLPVPVGKGHWEWEEGWVQSDEGWDVCTGTITVKAVDWKVPGRSPVRTLMDGGEGPPMLRQGCLVLRGVDWESQDDDGKDSYDREKALREDDKRAAEDEDDKKKKKKLPSPKLPVGTVLSIEPWKGKPGLARRVRWHLTDREGLYRYGADGGRHDLAHVEVNDKGTRIRRRHPLPEFAEQCAARHGFGAQRKYNVLLRLRRVAPTEGETVREGVLEYPDFGAAVRVSLERRPRSLLLVEGGLLYGSEHCGWHARFGAPEFRRGTVTELETRPNSTVGVSVHQTDLIDAATKNALSISATYNFNSTLSPGVPPSIEFDADCKASNISLSLDGRTVTCDNNDGRGTAYTNVGFTKGVHYWEVKIEQADIGSVFVGVAEKPPSDAAPKFNRWHGWGFVNFRATYTAGAERVYGAHCHAGDTVGVLLDCDAGRISFFFDGVKYGEHIMNDLGCAFENVSPFGFNADRCGSGGTGMGAPSAVEGGRAGRYPSNGQVRPKSLWPVVGLRNHADRVTLNSKWQTGLGIDGLAVSKNVAKVNKILRGYQANRLPDWFLAEGYSEYSRFVASKYLRTTTRGSGPHPLASFGLDVDLDTSPLACAAACAAL